MILDPGMIEPHVVGDEVEHQLAGRASGAARAAGPAPRRRRGPDAPCSR